MNLNYILPPTVAIFLALSGSAIAHHKSEGRGNPHGQGSGMYQENSNKQSDEFSLRGRDRAEERHYLKKAKKHKVKHKEKKHERKQGRYDYDESERYSRKRHTREQDDRQYDRYERQRRQEQYQIDPVGEIIGQSVSGVKSKINKVHQRAIESIDNKTRGLKGIDSRTEQPRQTKPWWSIFGGE